MRAGPGFAGPARAAAKRVSRETLVVSFLVRLILNAVALLIVAYLLPGVHVSSFTGALVAALVLGIVNAVVRPILVLLTLPVVILTLGLFTLVINAITFYAVGHLGIGLRVHGFGTAFIGALILGIVSFVLSSLVGVAEKTS
jgi:putative membrane protein